MIRILIYWGVYNKDSSILGSILPCFLGSFLEGQGDLVSGLIITITHIGTLAISILNLLTKFP